ncbi:hypothetical protein [Rhizobium mayense]|uniref:Uncharacterized protein n=1 Tax=Rhizobium mayense TaxID=1312184 RepID=A0ABT7JXE7_9HYPH|nr:hypothetical protein [Rhizobium mayense]MDL2401024.1 hypothetical protein [Rhizobium mayense]
MSNQYVDDIDAALQRLVDLRRKVVPSLGTDDKAMDALASIQDSLVHLVKARDQEDDLAKGKTLYEAAAASL